MIAFARAAGCEVFVDHELVEGQQTRGLSGVFRPEVALRLLLAGTGLDARFAGERAYTLVAKAADEPAPDRPPSWSSDARQSRFYAGLQTAIRQALCGQDPALGRYRAALAVWTDAVGRIERARLLSRFGDDQAQQLLEALRQVAVGQPTPAGLEQPVVLVVLPRTAEGGGECAPRATAHR